MDPEDFCKEILEDLLWTIFPREETSQQGVWGAEQSLGPGWKSCLITPARGFCPEKRMFYSPSGKIFNSRESAIKFLQKTFGKRPSNSPASSDVEPRDFCQVQIDASDSSAVVTDQEEDDTISLSDEDLGEPPSKKSKCEKMTAEPISASQEEILVRCYNEWPRPAASVVAEIVKDSGLLAQVIISWYAERTRNIIEHILCYDNDKTLSYLYMRDWAAHPCVTHIPII